MLEPLGERLVKAKSGREALRFLLQEDCALILRFFLQQHRREEALRRELTEKYRSEPPSPRRDLEPPRAPGGPAGPSFERLAHRAPGA